VRRKGDPVADRLGALALSHRCVAAVRGAGLIWGVQLDGVPAADVVARAMERSLLLVSAGPDVVRLLPPLTVSDAELEHGITILEETLQC
jgi:4-aminobutyrate aminotransferase-like enzyme